MGRGGFLMEMAIDAVFAIGAHDAASLAVRVVGDGVCLYCRFCRQV